MRLSKKREKIMKHLWVIAICMFLIVGSATAYYYFGTEDNSSKEVNVCLHLSDYGCSTISHLNELGVRWVRTDWVTSDDNSMGDYSQSLEDNDINLLAIVNMSKFGSKISLEEWSETVRAIVSSEGFNNTDAVEICNEPNNLNYSVPEQTYYEMLKSAYSIIKSYTDIPVVFAGVSPNCGDWQSYLNTVFVHDDIEDYFDIMGIHLYDDMNMNIETLEFVRSLSDKPIWVTESGCPSFTIEEEYDEELQANYLSSLYESIHPLVDKMFIYEFSDNSGLSDPKENYFGLLTVNGTKKEAYYRVWEISR
jgi:hypothetical protein